MFVKHGDGEIVSVFEIEGEEELDDQKKKFRRHGANLDEDEQEEPDNDSSAIDGDN